MLGSHDVRKCYHRRHPEVGLLDRAVQAFRRGPARLDHQVPLCDLLGGRSRRGGGHLVLIATAAPRRAESSSRPDRPAASEGTGCGSEPPPATFLPLAYLHAPQKGRDVQERLSGEDPIMNAGFQDAEPDPDQDRFAASADFPTCTVRG